MGNFGDFWEFWGVKNPKKIKNFFLTGIDPEWSEMHFKPKISIFKISVLGNFGVILAILGQFLGSKIAKKIENFFLTGFDPEWSEMRFKAKISVFISFLGHFGAFLVIFWQFWGSEIEIKSKKFFSLESIQDSQKRI